MTIGTRIDQIKHVRQQHPNGCGTACIAMILGTTYEEARHHVGGDFERGMTHYEWFEAFARSGLAVQFIFQRQQKLGNESRVRWPLLPWAPVHIVQCGNHYVVLLSDGSVLDPALPPHIHRTLSDYEAERIYTMGGVWPVGGCPDFAS